MLYANGLSDTMYIEIMKYHLHVEEKGFVETVGPFKQIKDWYKKTLDKDERKIFDKEFGGINYFFGSTVTVYDAFNKNFQTVARLSAQRDTYLDPRLGGDWTQQEADIALMEFYARDAKDRYLLTKSANYRSFVAKLDAFKKEIEWAKFEQYFVPNKTVTKSKNIYPHIKANLTNIEVTEEIGGINKAIIKMNITLTNEEEIVFAEDPSFDDAKTKIDSINNDIYLYYTDVMFRKYDVFSLILGKNYIEEFKDIRNITGESYNYRCHFIGYITELHTSFTETGIEFEVVLQGFEQLMNEIETSFQKIKVKGKYNVWQMVLGEDLVGRQTKRARKLADLAVPSANFVKEVAYETKTTTEIANGMRKTKTEYKYDVNNSRGFKKVTGEFDNSDFLGHLLMERSIRSYYSAEEYPKHIYVYFRTRSMSYAYNDIVSIGETSNRTIKGIEKAAKTTPRKSYTERDSFTNKELNEIREQLNDPEMVRKHLLSFGEKSPIDVDSHIALSSLGLLPGKMYWRKKIYMPDIYTLDSRLKKYKEKYPAEYAELEAILKDNKGRGLNDVIIATFFGYVEGVDTVIFDIDDYNKDFVDNVPEEEVVSVFEYVHDMIANSQECVFTADLPPATSADFILNEDYQSRHMKFANKNDSSEFFENGIYFLEKKNTISQTLTTDRSNYSSMLSIDYLSKWIVNKSVYSPNGKTMWQTLQELAETCGCYCFTSWFFTPSADSFQVGYLEQKYRKNFRKSLYMLYFVSKKEWLDYALEISERLFGRGSIGLIVFNPLGVNKREKQIINNNQATLIQVINADATVNSTELKPVNGVIYDPVNKLDRKEMQSIEEYSYKMNTNLTFTKEE